MSYPVPERIMQTLKTRIEAVTTGNSYEVTVSQVVRPKRNASDSYSNNTVVLSSGDPERDEENDHSGNPIGLGYRLPVTIDCYLLPSDTDSTAIETLGYVLASEVQRGITNATNWQRFGSDATNAMFGNLEWSMPSDGGPASVRLNLSISYRIAENDPRTARP